MERNFNKNELYPDCPIRNILNRISDKWTLLVLYTLNGHESMRFRDISAELKDISQKMLVLTLRTLETDGFVKRKIYAEVPPRVEYMLTERAHSLFPSSINSYIGLKSTWTKSCLTEQKQCPLKTDYYSSKSMSPGSISIFNTIFRIK